MIFRQVDEILSGQKTQTRRVVKDGEYFVMPSRDSDYYNLGIVCSPSNRIKWQEGRTYAIVPKRGQPAIQTHRIKIAAIRQERLQDISAEDAIAEGINEDVMLAHNGATPEDLDRVARKIAIGRYSELWASINTRKGTRWEDNPLVWVIEFECVAADD